MKYKIFTIINSLLIIMLLILNLYSLHKISSLSKKNQVTYNKKDDLNQHSEYMTKEEVALFLNISLDKLTNILVEEEKDRKQMDSYDTFRFLRYTQIYGKKIFKRSDIINWLDYNIEHRKVINY